MAVDPSSRLDRLGWRRASAYGLSTALFLTLCLGGSAARAQHYPFLQFTADDGLAATQVWEIRQDRRGLLWLSTTWGFQRYDGIGFVTLSTPQGMPSPNSRTVLEDSSGDLWFGTSNGLARYDGHTVEAMRDVDGAPSGTIWSSAIDRAGRLWFASDRGLVRWSDGAFRTFGRSDGLASDYVYGLLVASDGAVWAGSRGDGAARCELDDDGNLAGCRIFTHANGLGADTVRAFAEDKAGRILVGTRGGGLSLYENGTMRRAEIAASPPSHDIYSLLVRRSGEIAIGYSPGGLLLCSSLVPAVCRRLGERNGLIQNEVRALFEDREGSLWIGTEGGMAQLVRDDIWNYGRAEGLPSPHIYSLAADGGDGVWVGTVDGLAHLQVGSHGEPSSEVWGRADGLRSSFIWALLRDHRGGLWVGTEDGLCRKRTHGFDCLGTGDGLPSAYILSLGEDSRGVIWAGTTAGVARIEVGNDGRVRTVRAYTRADGLAIDRSYGLVVDRADRVWVAHADGMSVIENDQARAVGAADGMPWKVVRGLGLDRDGRLLVGGYGKLARYEPNPARGLFHVWETVRGLTNEVVLTLEEDDQGRLVLGTSGGVLLFDPAADDGAGNVVARLDKRSGGAASEISHSSASVRDGAGRLWFGFKGGLSCVPRELAPPEQKPPSLFFSRLESEHGRIYVAPFSGIEPGPVGWLGSRLPELPHDDNSLRLEVRALSFERRGDLHYQFRLAEVEHDWSDPRGEPFRYLMNLEPGSYTLEARAEHEGGSWGPLVELAFRIEPAWWQTRSFRYGILLGVAALLVATVGWRLRRADTHARELERRIAERTDDLARYATALADHLQTVDRASDRARRAEAARRDLFARTSHELRTPLTAILGFSELLERSLGERLEGRDRRYLGNVRESGELLLRQINNLLDQLKLEAGRMEIHLDEISLVSMLESVASLMEGYALHRGVRIEVRAADDLPLVRVDVAKLRQVLMNLLSNAVKFSPAGETVTISAVGVSREASPWRVPAYEISIRDRGPGIPADAVETIFEPYRQLERGETLVPGTGLGLPIARQFVELLGGSIDLHSEPGHGSLFRVLMPCDPEPLTRGGERSDSGGFEPQRSQLLAFDTDRERFAHLAQICEANDVLAVRVEDADALRSMLATLKPRLLVSPFDPAVADSWARISPLLAAAHDKHLPLVLLPWIGDRAVALPFAGVLSPRDGEETVRRVLRAGGASPRTVGRRPLILVAAARETGMRLGTVLSAAGCDHFRVEGADAARAALQEAPPDAVASDLHHALVLATTAPPALAPRLQSPGWILIDAERPEPGEMTALAERLLEPGASDIDEALAGVARLAVASPRNEAAG